MLGRVLGFVQFWLRAALVIALAIAAGCQSPERLFPRIVNEAAPVRPELRARFGVIGVLPVAWATNIQFAAPAGRNEAFDKVPSRAWEKTYRTMESDDNTRAEVVRLAASSVLSLSPSAISAFISGVPEADYRRAQDAMRLALAEKRIDAGVQSEIAAALHANKVPGVVVLPLAAMAKIKSVGDQADLSGLASEGIDTVLDISVAQIGFEVVRGENPDIAFAPELVAHVRSVVDGRVLHSQFFDYRGEQRKFTEWGAHDAAALRRELAFVDREFARAILEHFLPPPAVPAP